MGVFEKCEGLRENFDKVFQPYAVQSKRRKDELGGKYKRRGGIQTKHLSESHLQCLTKPSKLLFRSFSRLE